MMAVSNLLKALAACLLVSSHLAYANECKTYTKLDGNTRTGEVLSTINVPDAFDLGSVTVGPIQMQHVRIGALKISLTAAGIGVQPITTTLKSTRQGGRSADLQGTSFASSASSVMPSDTAASPFAGEYLPAEPLSAFSTSGAGVVAGAGGSLGAWTLRVVDLGEAAESRPITMQSWSITLCPTGAASESAAPGEPQQQQQQEEEVNIVADEEPAITNSTAGMPNIGGGSLLGAAAQFVRDATTMNITSPNVTASDGPSTSIGSGQLLAGAMDRIASLLQPLGVDPTYFQAISAKLMGGIGNGNLVTAFGDSPTTRFFESMRGMLRENIEQAIALWKEARAIRSDFVNGNAGAGIDMVTKESELVKEFLTARIDNYDTAMKALNQLAQKAISGSAAMLLKDLSGVQSASTSIRDGLAGLSGTASEQVKSSLDQVTAASDALTDVAGKLTGDFTGIMSTLAQSLQDQLNGIRDTYSTSSNLLQIGVKTAVSGQINQLNNMLDDLNGALDQASKGTGPLAGKAIETYQSALTSLKSTLDTLKQAIVSYTPGENIKKVTEPLQQAAGGILNGGGIMGSISKAAGRLTGGILGGSTGEGVLQSYRPGSMMAQLTNSGSSSDADAGSSSVLGQFIASGSIDAGMLQLLQNINRFGEGFNKLFPGNYFRAG